ncbi:hypothetical protein L2E82_10583 [Cichorium intybus]|uniref:Uncharacterized protein n=1 Tax=Cichorium intybus TaxID=13427 RepID=A0ACB9GAR6_CICIN|nr:hypothetical protein L2E82_10583 [Cichorium intybus]
MENISTPSDLKRNLDALYDADDNAFSSSTKTRVLEKGNQLLIPKVAKSSSSPSLFVVVFNLVVASFAAVFNLRLRRLLLRRRFQAKKNLNKKAGKRVETEYLQFH